MIVRESPRRGRVTTEPAWPPRSPGQAALSSPSGRRRMEALIQQRRQRDGSTSPSPSKRRALDLKDGHFEADKWDMEDEDEETLQLKLQKIEAKLKLRKLRKTKENIEPSGSAKWNTDASSRERLQGPASPKRSEPAMPVSPRRVQLGIDKGLKAEQVSLKRPAASRMKVGAQDDQIIRREPKPISKSFSERLAEARSQDRGREERQDRFREKKSAGFGVLKNHSPHEISSHNERSSSMKELIKPRPMDPASSSSNAKELGPVGSEISMTKPAEHDPFSGFDLSKRHLEHSLLDKIFHGKDLFRLPQILKQVAAPDYEPPDVENDYVIFATIASKSTPKDQATVHKQSSTADKDDPANHRKKFMVLHLTDLKWELDLFLFDAAFDAFWKLTVGSVVAILNPGIMPPKPHMRDSGQFSLKLACSEDALIEIGMAKHLGWCKSIKKDGEKCGQWVDTRKTEFCDFHVNLQIEKTRASRPEVNSMVGLGMFDRAGSGRRPGRSSSSSAASSKGKGQNSTHFKSSKRHINDWEARHEIAFSVPRNARLNAAKLLDADDYAHGETQRERDIRRAQQRKSERKLLAQLGAEGIGQGREYARLRQDRSTGGPTMANNAGSFSSGRSKADLNALGLAGGSAASVKLSPIKGGRYKGLSSTQDQMGWGGAYKRGLLEPSRGLSPVRKSIKTSATPERQSREMSPSKQARFQLPNKRGLRLPGRDSLPMDARNHDTNDDDDLDIVH